ncbi:hypothetical protein Poli38472_012266 [Pythium oligandrum]|uniref:Galactose-binding like protein n=1 Tax=Pythium oligandrum TaxID=41045 RepID=A0A8K1CPK4_PYTOL|nr:hypothetical protein Poli38472_012266 [Pythium oligandrum]|eukprot:TMW67150.1 hypothetical protein Poli38472_012266 [Pythium oligandrum]
MSPRSLVSAPTTCRVSSVLDRNKTLYGADHMLSSDVTTCWNSAQGSPQQILLQFHRAVRIERLDIMFQGGFVGQDVDVRFKRSSGAEWNTAEHVDVDPEDTNDLQTFACALDDVDALQLVFKRSTDFYGRVIIYRLDVLGEDTV